MSFTEAVKRGNGTITIKDGAGNFVESFDTASNGRISIANNILTIDPTNDLLSSSQYFVSFAAGSVKDIADNSSYNFTTAAGGFNIDLVYGGDTTYKTYFDQAKALWEKVITGDLPNVGSIDDLQITASVNYIDGAGGILGQATPTELRASSHLPDKGTMTFDSADMATMTQSGTLERVILHEMGHVLGIGSLWQTFGFNSTFGQYTGTNAVAQYQSLSGNGSATYVPLETSTGNAGTDNVHWSEATFKTELMTGFAEPAGTPMPLSKLTVGALADLGYQVNYAVAEPYALNPFA